MRRAFHHRAGGEAGVQPDIGSSTADLAMSKRFGILSIMGIRPEVKLNLSASV